MNRYERDAEERQGCIAVIIVFLLIAIISFGYHKAFVFNDTEHIVTITDKERNDKSDKYLIFAEYENGETVVFENTDKWLRFKFASSDIQAELKEGKKYKLTTIGYRMPIFSWYQNIIKMEEIE